jgi:hypothetical protein
LPGLNVKLQLVPESLRTLLRNGVALRAGANQAADGVASISITRAEAKLAHIPNGGSQAMVVIGRGTVKGILSGTTSLRLHLSKRVAAKLKRLHSVVLTVKLTALDSRGERQTIEVTGRY